MTVREMFEATGEEYMLRQLSEECCELGKAALKVVRVMNDETPMSMGEARENLVEEIADVLVMITVLKAGLLTAVENEDIEQTMDRKFDRFIGRIEKRMRKRANENPAT